MQDANELGQNCALYALIGSLLFQRSSKQLANTDHGCQYFTIQILDLIYQCLIPTAPPVFCKPQLNVSQPVPTARFFVALQRDDLSTQLRYLVAAESEDNYQKVKTFLQKNLSMAAVLITSKGSVIDAAGRRFSDCSAYGYLYWAGDQHLLNLLDQFTDNESKHRLYLECAQIKNQGLTFAQNTHTTSGSPFFSMKPLIEAAYAYQVAAVQLNTEKNWSIKAWKPAQSLWLNLGKEQRNVPVWVAQFFCSPSPTNPASPRTTVFHNLVTLGPSHWFLDGKPNPDLGVSISIQTSNPTRAWGLATAPTAGFHDLKRFILIHRHIRHLSEQKLKKLAISCALTETNTALDHRQGTSTKSN